MLTKELSKLFPFHGQAAEPALSVSMLEAADWSLAKEFESVASHQPATS